jgi:hypothetical protein
VKLVTANGFAWLKVASFEFGCIALLIALFKTAQFGMMVLS